MRPTLPATSFTLETIGGDYPRLLDYLERHGSPIESRIGLTKNLWDVTVTLLDPERSLAGRRAMSDSFALEEATQILAGRYDGARLGEILPRAAELITPATAYGPRVWPQLERVEAELRESPSSRRAVVYVGRHDDIEKKDDDATAREMPCTALWQFDLSGGALNMYVTMRSNDAVWGFTYDVPSFTAVQRALATALGAPLGVYRHHAGSFHLYERHFGWRTWERPEDRFDLDGLVGSTMIETRRLAEARMRG